MTVYYTVTRPVSGAKQITICLNAASIHTDAEDPLCNPKVNNKGLLSHRELHSTFPIQHLIVITLKPKNIQYVQMLNELGIY